MWIFPSLHLAPHPDTPPTLQRPRHEPPCPLSHTLGLHNWPSLPFITGALDTFPPDPSVTRRDPAAQRHRASLFQFPSLLFLPSSFWSFSSFLNFLFFVLFPLVLRISVLFRHLFSSISPSSFYLSFTSTGSSTSFSCSPFRLPLIFIILFLPSVSFSLWPPRRLLSSPPFLPGPRGHHGGGVCSAPGYGERKGRLQIGWHYGLSAMI